MIKNAILALAAILSLTAAHKSHKVPQFKGTGYQVVIKTVPKHHVMPKLTTQQRERALALTLFGEARGESYDGMMAVGWVIMNRVAAGKAKYGEYHTEQVVWQRKQFSCWNGGTDPNLKILRHIGRLKPGTVDYRRWQRAKVIAYLLIHNKAGVDPTKHATHYSNLSIVKPYWLKDMKKTASVGSHTFYRTKKSLFSRIAKFFKV